jgi:glycerol kinase
MFGLSRGTGRAEIARATLESVCYQTCDLLQAMQRDWGEAGNTILRVDGGMVASDWTMQRLADLVNAEVDRPRVMETTALGAAWLAGMQSGFYGDKDEFAQNWGLDKRFSPTMDDATRSRKYSGWQDAISRTLSRPA